MGVNACVILRPNNFDPPCDCLSNVDTLQDSHSVFQPHSSSVRLPYPVKGASPPGHAVVDGWSRDERTRDTPQSPCVRSSRLPSLPQLSRLYTPFAPTASTRSLRMPTEQGHSALDSHKPTLAEGLSAAPGEVDPTTPTTVRQHKIDPPFIFDPHRQMRHCDLSCGSCDH